MTLRDKINIVTESASGIGNAATKIVSVRRCNVDRVDQRERDNARCVRSNLAAGHHDRQLSEISTSMKGRRTSSFRFP